MFRFAAGLCLLVSWLGGRPGPVSAQDWPAWRGPEGNNHAPDDVSIPLRWDLDSGRNVVWKTEIPGRGHSTPIVVGDSLFLTTSDSVAKTQSLLKVDRDSGRLVDQWVLHQGTLPARIHVNNSHASPTPVFAEDHLYRAGVCHSTDVIRQTVIAHVENRPQQSVQPKDVAYHDGFTPVKQGQIPVWHGGQGRAPSRAFREGLQNNPGGRERALAKMRPIWQHALEVLREGRIEAETFLWLKPEFRPAV